MQKVTRTVRDIVEKEVPDGMENVEEWEKVAIEFSEYILRNNVGELRELGLNISKAILDYASWWRKDIIENR